MSTYAAEVDANGIVQRVIVGTPEWAVEHLGGTWVETADPYNPTMVVVDDSDPENPVLEESPVAYCGPGYGYADNLPEKFAPQWQQPVAAPDGTWPYNGGEIVFHEGRLWKNVTVGVPNVWEPGVSGWHDAPEVGLPAWVQPTGAHDAYKLGAEVTHKGSNWRNTGSNANVWEPGVFGWVVF